MNNKSKKKKKSKKSPTIKIFFHKPLIKRMSHKKGLTDKNKTIYHFIYILFYFCETNAFILRSDCQWKLCGVGVEIK